MSEKSEKKSFWKKFKHRYRLSIYRDETFEELLNFRLTKLNIMAIAGAGVFLFLLVVILVIAFTPAKNLIPGYPNEKTVRNIRLNNFRLDSLEQEITKRDNYFENLRRIISGEEPQNYVKSSDTLIKKADLTLNKTREDSILRSMIQSDDQFGLSEMENKKNKSSLSNVLFFPPVKGMITNSFSTKHDHYGTDIVSSSNEVVKSTLAGTVILASWTLETGYVIEVQHNNNLVSVYKHNAELLKHTGDRVKAGEPIAIIGNSGELTTGPHLHFELWYNGAPLNPEDYITF